MEAVYANARGDRVDLIYAAHAIDIYVKRAEAPALETKHEFHHRTKFYRHELQVLLANPGNMPANYTHTDSTAILRTSKLESNK